MNRKIVLHISIMLFIFLSGCSLLQDIIISSIPAGTKSGEKKDTKKDQEPVQAPSPSKQIEVLCSYAHYFRARNNDFSQWWYPGKDPNNNLGPEPWRRDLWIGRVGDYPYIGPYDNVEDKETMRWHIRLAKASGITAFILAINNWEEERPQTNRLLEVANEENFKIGFMESHSFLGARSLKRLDGDPQPIISPKYVGYDRITEQYSQKTGVPLPSEKTRYIRPKSRGLRAVPPDALDRASERISNMLNLWKSQPAYLRIDGKPIIVIPYMDTELTPADFKTLVGKIKANVKEDLYVVAIVPFVYWYFYPPAVPNSGITQEWAGSEANTFTNWTPNGMITATQKTRLKATQFNAKDSLKWKKDSMIPVMPAFNDDAWRPGEEPAPTTPNDNGQAWRDQLEAAITAKPRFIFIQAWNEWHEGSQIEPSTYYSDPYLYLQILAQKLNKPWQPPALPPQSSVDPLRLPYLSY